MLFAAAEVVFELTITSLADTFLSWITLVGSAPSAFLSLVVVFSLYNNQITDLMARLH